MGSNIFRLLDAGARPQQDHLDFITWRKRDWNKLADHLVNVTMDHKSSWNWQDEAFIKALPRDFSQIRLLCFSDGGLRASTGAAASAWVAFISCDYGWRLLAKGGVHYSRNMCASSFIAEALALDSCLAFAATVGQVVSER